MRPSTDRRRRRARERGVYLVVLAVAMLAVFGFAGVAIDGGRAQELQRGEQNAADAAVLAAGTVLNGGAPGSIPNENAAGVICTPQAAAALQAAAVNGVLTQAATANCAAATPPAAGSYCYGGYHAGFLDATTGGRRPNTAQYDVTFYDAATHGGPVPGTCTAQTSYTTKIEILQPPLAADVFLQVGGVGTANACVAKSATRFECMEVVISRHQTNVVMGVFSQATSTVRTIAIVTGTPTVQLR